MNRYIFLSLFCFLISCGIEINGNYTAIIENKNVVLRFGHDGDVILSGYFPNELSGKWVEEKTFKEAQIWATFDGPKEKPFRLRFELKPNGQDFQLIGIKARPIGKGMKLNPVEFKGKPIFKP